MVAGQTIGTAVVTEIEAGRFVAGFSASRLFSLGFFRLCS